MKQETLEEVVNAFKKTDVYINEIKQKQERSYSEEEVLGILVKAMKDVKIEQLTFFDGGSEYPIYSNLSNWFEQFKKK